MTTPLETQKYISLISKSISNADVIASPTTGNIEVVPTFGLGKIIIPIFAHVHLKSTVAYTNFDPLFLFALARGTVGLPYFTMDQVDTLLGSAVDIDGNMLEQQVWDLPADVINKPLNLRITNGILGNLTGGASTNRLDITVGFVVKRV